ncbi:hypothetical protein EJ06DRAFT_17295 [Trichodelitschia bisporula]|uniref:Ubiquitin-like domain-containing protein n=1 Tax=Trichodelitschia bisporula TaxID=703511 RepID=A0A6G1IAB0_9PEZI|nr:hypothetical protein EJ06DRAFT_17295 [Trichodelitschia bisporula]
MSPLGMLKPSEDDVDDDDDDEDDPELRELARRARERARARQQEAEGQSAEALSNEPNPIISIFIHSETIPDTRELFVKRRYRQRLREVRLGWCKANNFGPVLTSQVFFTWRGRRLFDSADFRSVGVKLDEFGGPMMEGEGFNDDRIVFLATTQELETKAREAEERRRREEEAAAGGDEDEPEAAPEERIHVVLKAKGYEEFKLVVKPISTFAQIANAFRKERDIPANKEIILMFDGDCLEPEDTMAQSEIEDLDNIEVYLKD